MNLASIQRIISVEDIPNSDFLQKVGILGWVCVVKKGQFKVGDLACYCQIDTITPQLPYFEFLAERKYRIRTIKLRGQISQGLVLSITDMIAIIHQIKFIRYLIRIGKVIQIIFSSLF